MGTQNLFSALENYIFININAHKICVMTKACALLACDTGSRVKQLAKTRQHDT